MSLKRGGLSLIGVLAALTFVSCGSSNSSTFVIPKQGSLYTFIGDSPACDVLGLRIRVSGLKFRVAGTTDQTFTLFPSASSAPLYRVNFASLRDSSTVLTLSSVNVGSYDQATITFITTQIILYDPTSDPPVKVISGTLTTASPTIPLQPNLTIAEGKLQALRIDLDMARSIGVDAQGEVTDKISPAVRASVVTPNAADGYGAFDDLLGFVTSVSAFPTGNFAGTFSLQILAGTGSALTINLTAQTDMYGVPDLASLETGRFVEVNAYIDSNGFIVARTIEAEDRADVTNKTIAFLGYVLPTPTRDTSGNVTQFKFYVSEEEPDLNREVPLDSVIVVNVSPSTTYQVSSRSMNFENLPFDATSVTAGQELVIHGQYTTLTDQPTVLAANSVYLKIQTLQGALSSLVQAGSDGKTGAFWFDPCARVQQGVPILVLTRNDTTFLNVLGLAGITPNSTLLVRGLPFYTKDAWTTKGGVSVPAGTLVVLAEQVHQLQ